MRHRLASSRIILECVYAMLFSCACMLFAMHVFAKEDAGTAHIVCMCVLCILSYISREFLPNNLLEVTAHLLMTVIIAFLPLSAFSRVFICICCVAVMLPKSIAYMRKGGKMNYQDNISWPSILACFVFSLFGLADDSTVFSGQMYYIVICLLILILIRIYLSGACRYIECTTQVDGLPIGEIVKTNTRVVALIVILTLILMLTFGSLGMEDVLAVAAQKALQLIKIVASFIIFFATIIVSRLFGQVEVGQEQTYTDYSYDSIPETGSTFAMIITGILIAAVLIGLICFGVKLIRQLIGILLMRRVHTNDIVENRRKGEYAAQSVKPAGRRLFPVTREERFRRMYMYEIERYDIILDRYKTCSDIEAEVKGSSQGDVHEINELYKSVRYGGRRVDRGTLRELNYLIKKKQPRSIVNESDSGKRTESEA